MNASVEQRLLKAQSSLTHRDMRLLGWLYDHGVLTTDQIDAALFGSLTFCQRRLLRLIDLGVLARFRPQRWEGGSYPYHYLLAQLGTEIVAAQRGDPLPRRDQARQRRQHLTSRANLPHLLATNQFFIDLAAHERVHSGGRLDTWRPAADFHRATAFYRPGDGADMFSLRTFPRPDGHGIWVDRGRRVPFLLEMDRGTESLPVLTAKVTNYLRVADHARWWWPVLFWLPSVRREINLQRLLADLPASDRVATAASDHVAASGLSPAGPVWWLHGREQPRQHLSELPFLDSQEGSG
ncbi:replication-relaxation family protein [Actinoplanes sichuanensis]|uniref:Replication-relaxation family protein n=1 Tax=Actinoplanes sichuanensis TaxID=512349 RepID=A0ABW4A2K0_9ACTN|nr:replication-relaxation family protein [Actinoplanes sichuanensis]